MSSTGRVDGNVVPFPAALGTIGRICFALPLIVFGAEHFILTKSLENLVPAWLHARLFWTYFVGVALIAGGLSLVTTIQMRLAAALVACLMFLFVALIWAPNTFAKPTERLLWIVCCRELTFAAGPAVLAYRRVPEWLRIFMAVVLLFFGVEHFLHANCVPGIPLEKTIPPYIPGGEAWSYLTGVLLLVGAVVSMFRRWAQTSFMAVGMLMLFLVVTFYLPIMLSQKDIEGLNYVADTMMFGGSLLLIAKAISREPEPVRNVKKADL
ncbi:MAG: hypothetical protein JOY53_10180 [Acidobacteriaceae bacterium]|nr:hypothetical protein [Acidobacteriaceae bacterium]